MILNLKSGMDGLLFGMKQPDVIALYGKPDRKYNDDEDNIVFIYNTKMVQATFYEDEDLKLGYLMSANPELQLFDKKLIGRTPEEVKAELNFKPWEVENSDLAENHFNEANWIILQSEFGKIVKVELGAIINDKDEFEWKFKK